MKPIVKYKRDSFFPEVGYRAWVYAIDHPNFFGERLLYTSTVLYADKETGNFETVNTLYVREDDDV